VIPASKDRHRLVLAWAFARLDLLAFAVASAAVCAGVLFALTVGGLSQRKVVRWVRRFLGGTLSPATIGAVLARFSHQVFQELILSPDRRYRSRFWAVVCHRRTIV